MLRAKWGEVPLGNLRVKSNELERMSDSELFESWEAGRRRQTEGTDGFSLRGWYHALYKPILHGKKVLDVGSGSGVDGISFALAGARVTFLDIVESNLQLIRRVCGIVGARNTSYVYLEDEKSLDQLARDFDVIWCQGSQITAPFEIVKEEDQVLMEHMKPDGRWIELAYPKSRWEREGMKPFESWGMSTDGGAPWIEWYDLDKLLRRLEPSRFEAILHFEFHDSDFVWFDLLRVE